MNAMVQIRRLACTDYPDLQKCAKLFRESVISEDEAKDFLKEKNNHFLIAMIEDCIAGYLLAYQLPRFDGKPDMLHIYHLFVLPEFQKRGVASKLMEEILLYARENKLHYVYLITQKENDAANALYEKMDGLLHPSNKNVYYWYITGEPKQ